jgi:hypothetical protein
MTKFLGLILTNLLGGALIYFASVYCADALWFAYTFLYFNPFVFVFVGIMAVLLCLVEIGLFLQTSELYVASKPNWLGLLLIGIGLFVPFAYILLSGGWKYFWQGPIVSAVLLLLWSYAALFVFKFRNSQLLLAKKA